jgi:hypothetical protein
VFVVDGRFVGSSTRGWFERDSTTCTSLDLLARPRCVRHLASVVSDGWDSFEPGFCFRAGRLAQ